MKADASTPVLIVSTAAILFTVALAVIMIAAAFLLLKVLLCH